MKPYVLYVDDDSANPLVFQSGFGEALPVLTASSGSAALQLLAQHEVAVLLADQRMPGMTGIQLMERVHREHPDVVRMIITAYSDIEACIDAINRGSVDAYFKKPWVPAELQLALSQARARYQAAKWTKELERRLITIERTYALGVITAGIAHELRNPLTSLGLSVQLLRQLVEELPRGSDQAPPLERAFTDVEYTVQTIVDITHSMELSTRNRKTSWSDLREVIGFASRSVLGELRTKGRIEYDLAPIARVRASRTQLGQIVLNLLVNAVQSLDEQHRNQNVIRVILSQDGFAVLLTVADTGGGIHRKHLEHIFDSFFTTKSDGGTGLGLAISKRIVAELGGTIDVNSVPGRGTTFRVRLPFEGKVTEEDEEASHDGTPD